MKARQLLKATPSSIRQSARSVRIIDATRSRMKSTNRLRVVAVVSSRSRQNLKHKVVVESVRSGVDSLYDNDIRIFCNCEAFQYLGCRDVLPLYNAGFKKKATGIMPDIKNPQRIPFVCLHCVRVLNKILRDKK